MATNLDLAYKESRQHRSFNHRSKFGRSTVDIECPFCQEIVTAYIWSLAGSGKKCVCGAIHVTGSTLKRLTERI